MLKLVLRRLLITVPVLLIVTVMSFALIQLTPGDPARVAAGEAAPPEQVEAVRKSLGLDRPLYEQYFSFVGNAVQFDLGTSVQDSRPVGTIISETLPVTFSLGLIAVIATILIGVPAGALAAIRKGRFADRAVAAVASVFIAVPPFVIALVLVVPLAINHAWFPATGYTKFVDSPWEWFRHLVLPGITLALVSSAELARQVRGAMVDSIEQDFVRTSRAKGLSERAVLGKHAARSAAPTAVTVLGLQVGRILGGAVLVETVFALPGFGSLAVNAVITRDLPVVQGIVLVSALFVLLANLLVDVGNAYLNPKLRA